MPRANISSVTLSWSTSPPRSIDIRAVGELQTTGVDVKPEMQGAGPTNRQTLARLLSRWGAQLAAGQPITADLSDDGKAFA